MRSNVRTLTDVWLGDITFTRALSEGSLWVGGTPELRRSFPDWLGLSIFAGMARQPRRDRDEMRTMLADVEPKKG